MALGLLAATSPSQEALYPVRRMPPMSSALGMRGACSSSSDFLQATTQVSGKGTLVSYTHKAMCSCCYTTSSEQLCLHVH